MPAQPKEECASGFSAGGRPWIKGSVLQQQVSSLRSAHESCFYFVFPCSFDSLSSQKGSLCVWPHPEASVNFLPPPALGSPSCANLPCGESTLTQGSPPWALHSSLLHIFRRVPVSGEMSCCLRWAVWHGGLANWPAALNDNLEAISGGKKITQLWFSRRQVPVFLPANHVSSEEFFPQVAIKETF